MPRSGRRGSLRGSSALVCGWSGLGKGSGAEELLRVEQEGRLSGLETSG